MKQFSLNGILAILRAFIIVLLIALTTHLLSSFTVNRFAEDFWKQLGISQQAGTDNIKTSFLNNYFQYYGARNAKNIAIGNRAAVAKDLLVYSKSYLSSTAFKAEYEQLRADSKPAEPEKKTVRSKEEIRNEKIKETEDALKKLEASMKDMTEDMKKIMKPSLELYQQQIKDYKDPKNEMIGYYVMAEKYEVEKQQKDYEENYKKWEENYPVNVNELIKKRLKQYIDLSATVDFNAALIEKNRKMVFVKPAYEAKPADWKMIFRAGKEVNEVTKTFVQQWLNELK